MNLRLDPKKEELVIQNAGLVHFLVNKLGVPPNEFDDVVSVGEIGLIKAATTFDNSKNIKFATYATKCINNEILMYFRREQKHIGQISLQGTISYDKDGNELTLADIISAEEKDITEKIEAILAFEKLVSIVLNLLKSKERIVMLYWMAGNDQQYIAEILDNTQSYISRLEKRLINKIKSYFSTTEQFEEVFSMSMVDHSYKITFSSEDVSSFNKIFAKILTKLTSFESIPDFKVSCTKERTIIQLPANPESFNFIAKIVEEIDEFVLTFGLSKKSSKGQYKSSKLIQKESMLDIKADEINSTIQHNNDSKYGKEIEKVESIETNKTNKDLSKTDANSVKEANKVKQVRDYMLSRESFTVKELNEKFPELDKGSIGNALYLAKSKGLIKPIARGKYIVNKD